MSDRTNAAISGITPNSLSGEYERQRQVVEQLLSRVRTAYLGKVVAVSQNGTVEGIGTLDVQPCVSQLDGTGTVVEHGIVHTVPYLRIQGGSNAVILDPQPGDIGLVVVCDRDTSSARANRDVSAPGSLRKFDMSDSVYVATVLSGPPSQYVLIGPNGIDIVSPVRIRMLAPTIIMQADDQIGLQAGASVDTAAPVIGLDGAMTQGDGGFGGGAHIRSTLTADQDVVGGGKSLHDHTHRDSEGGTTSPPL